MGAALDAVDDALQHYGIRGMRWGVRRTRAQIDADSADVTKKKATQAKIKKNRTTDVLSNDELKALNERLNLEQNYIQLMQRQEASRPKSPMERGARWAGETALSIAQTQTKNIVNNAITKRIEDNFAEHLLTPTQQQKRKKAQDYMRGDKEDDD